MLVVYFCAGGTIYQPVTMVTSQGQVVTQAIPQGTIQIQNTQVRDCHFLSIPCIFGFEMKALKPSRLMSEVFCD